MMHLMIVRTSHVLQLCFAARRMPKGAFGAPENESERERACQGGYEEEREVLAVSVKLSNADFSAEFGCRP